jgi:hypothetical protein
MARLIEWLFGKKEPAAGEGSEAHYETGRDVPGGWGSNEPDPDATSFQYDTDTLDITPRYPSTDLIE